MTKAIKFFFTLCICLFVLFPFQVFAGEEIPAVSSTVKESGQSLPPSQGTETAADKSVAVTRQSQSAPSASSLVRLSLKDGPAKLVIRNQEIVTLRAEIAGLSPQGRVEMFRQRFDVAVSGSGLPEPIVKEISPYGSVILIGPSLVVSIAYLDIDPLGHKTHDQVVTETVAKLSQLLVEIREEHSIGAIIRAIGFSLLASLSLGFAIWVLLLLRKLFLRLLSSKIISAKGELALEQVAKLNVGKSRAFLRKVTTYVVTFLVIFYVFAWLAYVLKQFPYTRPWGEEVWSFVLDTMQNIGLVMLNALPNLFTIALILFIARSSRNWLRCSLIPQLQERYRFQGFTLKQSNQPGASSLRSFTCSL